MPNNAYINTLWRQSLGFMLLFINFSWVLIKINNKNNNLKVYSKYTLRKHKQDMPMFYVGITILQNDTVYLYII